MLLLFANMANVLGLGFYELSHDEKRPAIGCLALFGEPVLDHPTVPAVERVEEVRRYGSGDDPTNCVGYTSLRGRRDADDEGSCRDPGSTVIATDLRRRLFPLKTIWTTDVAVPARGPTAGWKPRIRVRNGLPLFRSA
jgi:hypothetical protein